MTTPRASTVRSQSVWVKEKTTTPQQSKPVKVSSLSNFKKRMSQVTEQFAGDTSQRTSCEVIELNEQACSGSVASPLVHTFTLIFF